MMASRSRAVQHALCRRLQTQIQPMPLRRHLEHPYRPLNLSCRCGDRQIAYRGNVNRLSLRVVSLLGGNKDDSEGGGGNNKNPFSNFSELLKTAQAAQARASVEAQKVQEELSKQEFDGYDEEETVKVVISGNQEPISVELTEDIQGLKLNEIEKRLIEAMRDSHSKSVTAMKDRMKKLYTDLGFPMPPQIQE